MYNIGVDNVIASEFVIDIDIANRLQSVHDYLFHYGQKTQYFIICVDITFF